MIKLSRLVRTSAPTNDGGGSLESVVIKVPSDDVKERVSWESVDMVVVDSVASSLVS